MPKQVSEIDRHVGAQVRARRIELRLSQSALGEAAGVTFQQIQKYEKGQDRISAAKLDAIATFLKTPISAFYAMAPQPGFAETGQPFIRDDAAVTAQTIELTRSFLAIRSPERRAAVLDLVRRLAEAEAPGVGAPR